MIALDCWLIDRVFQPWSEWLTDRTGRSCLWWGGQMLFASAVLTGAVAGMIVQLDLAEYGAILPGTWFYLIAALAWVGVLSYFRVQAKALDEKFWRNAFPAMNPLRLQYLLWRLCFAVFAAWIVIATAIEVVTSHASAPTFIGDLRELANFVAFYLLACTPRPPVRRKAMAGRLAFEGGAA